MKNRSLENYFQRIAEVKDACHLILIYFKQE